MLNPMQAWNAWARLTMQAAVTGFEAQSVMALRIMRLAAGGARARSEASRMITEKVTALGEAQGVAVRAAIKGDKSHRAAAKVLRVYKRRVRKNRRRLLK
jgi:malonyl CoA-acyl carrier protein transacylase